MTARVKVSWVREAQIKEACVRIAKARGARVRMAQAIKTRVTVAQASPRPAGVFSRTRPAGGGGADSAPPA